MSVEFKVKKAYQLLVRNILGFITTFENDERFDEYDLDLYELTKESIQELDKLPKVVEYANDIIGTLRSNHPEIVHYDYWRHYQLIIQQLEILEPIAEEMLNNEKFKQ